jgi:hypothetical protein
MNAVTPFRAELRIERRIDDRDVGFGPFVIHILLPLST